MVFRKLKKWVMVQWTLWKHAKPTVATIVVTLGCYVFGWWRSTVSDTGPLVHAGAFATAVSIALALHDYRGALKKSENAAIDLFTRILEDLPLTGPEALQRIAASARQNTQRAERTITWLQGGLLIVATLVWGFSDIAPRWVPWAFRPTSVKEAWATDHKEMGLAPVLANPLPEVTEIDAAA